MKRKPSAADVRIGQRIRHARNLAGLTQEQLADLLGITFQQLQKYEIGANRVSAARLEHIAKILKQPIEWFFDPVDAPRDDLMLNRNEAVLVRSFRSITSKKTRSFIMSMVRASAGQP